MITEEQKKQFASALKGNVNNAISDAIEIDAALLEFIRFQPATERVSKTTGGKYIATSVFWNDTDGTLMRALAFCPFVGFDKKAALGGTLIVREPTEDKYGVSFSFE